MLDNIRVSDGRELWCTWNDYENHEDLVMYSKLMQDMNYSSSVVRHYKSTSNFLELLVC